MKKIINRCSIFQFLDSVNKKLKKTFIVLLKIIDCGITHHSMVIETNDISYFNNYSVYFKDSKNDKTGPTPFFFYEKDKEYFLSYNDTIYSIIKKEFDSFIEKKYYDMKKFWASLNCTNGVLYLIYSTRCGYPMYLENGKRLRIDLSKKISYERFIFFNNSIQYIRDAKQSKLVMFRDELYPYYQRNKIKSNSEIFVYLNYKIKIETESFKKGSLVTFVHRDFPYMEFSKKIKFSHLDNFFDNFFDNFHYVYDSTNRYLSFYYYEDSKIYSETFVYSSEKKKTYHVKIDNYQIVTTHDNFFCEKGEEIIFKNPFGYVVFLGNFFILFEFGNHYLFILSADLIRKISDIKHVILNENTIYLYTKSHCFSALVTNERVSGMEYHLVTKSKKVRSDEKSADETNTQSIDASDDETNALSDDETNAQSADVSDDETNAQSADVSKNSFVLKKIALVFNRKNLGIILV
jgi:hypothetical protein